MVVIGATWLIRLTDETFPFGGAALFVFGQILGFAGLGLAAIGLVLAIVRRNKSK